MTTTTLPVAPRDKSASSAATASSGAWVAETAERKHSPHTKAGSWRTGARFSHAGCPKEGRAAATTKGFAELHLS